MRYLTVKRAKVYAACLGKMRVYIEDPAAEDIFINDAPCRLLGELKNGEEGTYHIGSTAARLYVIPEKKGVIYKEEFYPIPEGSENLTVTGRNIVDTSRGNPFLFDGISDPTILKNRSNARKKGIIASILLSVIIYGIVMAINVIPKIGKSDPKTFTVENMEITLTKGFKELSMENYIKAFESDSIIVAVFNEKFSEYPVLETYTLDGYGELLKEANSDKVMTTKKHENLTYLEYTYEDEDKEVYRYNLFIYESKEAFWAVEFWTFDEDYNDLQAKIFEYAKSVKFS